MALNIPTWPNPYDPGNPFHDVYAWMRFLAVDLLSGIGRVELAVHPHESAWQAQPLGSLSVALGEVLIPGDPTADPPVPEVRMDTLAELLLDEEFAVHFNGLGRILYAKLAAKHPALAGSAVV